MEGVPASILQSAQNVKVKLLSIIKRCFNSKLLLTYFQNSLPLPQPFKRDPLPVGKEGVLGGGKVGEMQGKKKKKTCR